MPQEENDRLILGHIALAVSIAEKMWRKFPPNAIPLEDFVGWANIGLVQAGRGFRPELGFAFTSYAAPKIRSAILDGIRVWFGREGTSKSWAALPMCGLADAPTLPVIDRQFARFEAQRDIAALRGCKYSAMERRAVNVAWRRANGVPTLKLAAGHGVVTSRISQLTREGIAAMRVAAGLGEKLCISKPTTPIPSATA